MNRRWICSDVWMDILPSFDRPQLGLKMALLSDRFDALVDTYFDGKTTELTLWNEIRICKDKEQKANEIGSKAKLSVQIDESFVDFPFPDRPLPNKIRFDDLEINYIDHSVITFLHANKHIWDRSGTKLELFIANDQQIWDVFVRQIWPIFAPNIGHLYLCDGDLMNYLLPLTSPTVLTDLDQLNSIGCFRLLLADEIYEQGPNATSAGQVLSKWLHTPSKDGQPKKMHCRDFLDVANLEWLNKIKEAGPEFLHANASANYRIFFNKVHPTPPIQPFELVNERTNEKLALINERDILWMLKRCPIIVGETAAAADQWEDDRNWGINLNGVQFNLLYGTNCIGPMSPPPSAAEKEKTDESNEN